MHHFTLEKEAKEERFLTTRMSIPSTYKTYLPMSLVHLEQRLEIIKEKTEGLGTWFGGCIPTKDDHDIFEAIKSRCDQFK